jgi:peptidoglycan-associated lipoprotein
MKTTNLVVGLLLLVTGLTTANCANQNKSPSSLRRVHFDFDSSSIRGDMRSIMDGNANYLKKYRNMNVAVEGHCDERGTNEYNYALGARRAEAAKSYLVTQGVNPGRLSTVSYGEDRPLKNGTGESVWYLNRRAEFVKK